MLTELLGLVISLVATANIVHGQGERYATGARIRSLLIALAGYDLPDCAQIGKILGGGRLTLQAVWLSGQRRKLLGQSLASARSSRS